MKYRIVAISTAKPLYGFDSLDEIVPLIFHSRRKALCYLDARYTAEGLKLWRVEKIL